MYPTGSQEQHWCKLTVESAEVLRAWAKFNSGFSFSRDIPGTCSYYHMSMMNRSWEIRTTYFKLTKVDPHAYLSVFIGQIYNGRLRTKVYTRGSREQHHASKEEKCNCRVLTLLDSGKLHIAAISWHTFPRMTSLSCSTGRGVMVWNWNMERSSGLIQEENKGDKPPPWGTDFFGSPIATRRKFGWMGKIDLYKTETIIVHWQDHSTKEGSQQFIYIPFCHFLLWKSSSSSC